MSLPLRLKEPTRETLAKAIVVVLPTLAYLNSFSGAFVFDDEVNILKNPSIRHLGSLGAVLSPPALSGAGGRPLTNLSLALNYALSGSQEWSYHALSLAIHLGCALLLFAILRETFRSPRLPPALIGQSVVIAGTAATLWAVHPVQTATVTYLSQRTEELMALFYLLLLWCFIRLVQTGQRRWWCGAIAAAAAGMASKETMVTAPLVLFLYDRTFLADSLAQAWAKRGRFHASVAATWAILAYFVVRTHLEQRGVGFALGIKSTTYLLAECRAVMTYLKLSVWPHPLVFDYGPVFSADAAAALPYAIPLALALAGTGWLLARNQPAGFGLGWFFIVLAPTSSIIPIIQQPIAENRMYLPLAGLLAVLTAALFRWIGPRGLWLAVAAAVAAAAATAARNQVYASEEHLWTETAAAYPANPRADFALGHLLARTGRDAEAVAKFEKAIRIAPSYIDAHTQLGVVLLRQGRVADAVRQFRQALILRPESVEARVDLGTALKTAGRYREAIEEFESALRLEPDLGAAHYDLALALQATGQTDKFARELGAALRLDPNIPEAHFALGNLCLSQGQGGRAIAEFERAIELNPGYGEAYNNLGNAYLAEGNDAEAAQAFRAAIRLQPVYPAAQTNLGTAEEQLGHLDEAIRDFRAALRADSQLVEAHFNLGLALERTGHLDAAQAEFKAALRLRPGLAPAQEHLQEIATRRAILPHD